MKAITKKISSKVFDANIGYANRMARNGPVIITVRGSPESVYMRDADYCRLLQAHKTRMR